MDRPDRSGRSLEVLILKLQLALDTLTTEGCIALLDRVRSYADIIEAGTPLIMRKGLSSGEMFSRHANLE